MTHTYNVIITAIAIDLGAIFAGIFNWNVGYIVIGTMIGLIFSIAFNIAIKTFPKEKSVFSKESEGEAKK